MKRVLLISNGHGENAIALRVAGEAAAVCNERGIDATFEHFPLVGEGTPGGDVAIVGPRRAMPSGGLVAMGNVRALAGDVRNGFAQLLARQLRFLRERSSAVDLAVAVGDVYALGIALQAHRPVHFVGTAKSVYVAPYGPFERTVLRRARRIFVRDAPTAARLRSQGVAAEAPGNVIVDLALEPGGAPVERSGAPLIGLLPGSRSRAYADAVRLAATFRALVVLEPAFEAVLSVAPALDPAIVARLLAEDGWAVLDSGEPGRFTARSGGARMTAWRGPIGPLLRASDLAAGQAGTANEMAAALGLPVIALELRDGGREDWYRMRQRKLLGDALAVVPAGPGEAAAAIAAIVRDPQRREAMRAAGPQRMGPPGGARVIGAAIADALDGAA